MKNFLCLFPLVCWICNSVFSQNRKHCSWLYSNKPGTQVRISEVFCQFTQESINLPNTFANWMKFPTFQGEKNGRGAPTPNKIRIQFLAFLKILDPRCMGMETWNRSLWNNRIQLFRWLRRKNSEADTADATGHSEMMAQFGTCAFGQYRRRYRRKWGNSMPATSKQNPVSGEGAPNTACTCNAALRRNIRVLSTRGELIKQDSLEN